MSSEEGDSCSYIEVLKVRSEVRILPEGRNQLFFGGFLKKPLITKDF